MKKHFYIIIAFYFFTSNILFSQTIEEKVKLFNIATSEGNYKVILNYADEVLEYKLKSKGEDEDYLNSLVHIIFGNYYGKEFLNVIKLSKKRLILTAKLKGENHNDYIAGLSVLASSYYALNMKSKANKKYEECYKKSILINDTTSANYLTYLETLSHINYIDFDNLLKSKFYIQKCINYYHNNPESNDNSFKNYYITLISICYDLQEYKETIKNYELSKKYINESLPLFLNIKSNIALSYFYNKDYSNSIKLNEELLNIIRKNDSLINIYKRVYSNLAVSYSSIGNHQMAIKLYNEIIPYFTNEEKKSDNYCLYNYSLAKEYLAVNNLNEAEKTSNICLQILKSQFQKDKKMKVLQVLMAIKTQKSEFVKSNELISILKKYWKKEKLQNSQGYYEALTYEAENYRGLGEYDLAIKKNIECINLIKSSPKGSNEINWVVNYNNLALNYRSLGDFNNALNYIEKVNNILKSNNEYNEIYLNSLSILALVYQDMDEYENSIQISNDIIKNVDSASYLFAVSQNNLGLNYQKMGNYNESLISFSLALKVFNNLKIVNDEFKYKIFNNLSLAYQKLGDYENAFKYIDLSFDVLKNIYGENHPEYALNLINLGLIHFELGDYENAAKFSLKSLNILENKNLEHSQLRKTTLSNLGLSFLNLNNFELADKYLKSCIDLYKKDNSENLHLLYALNNYSLIFTNSKQYLKAIKILDSILIISKKMQNESLNYTCLSNIGLNYLKLGDFKQSDFYLIKAQKNIQNKIDYKLNETLNLYSKEKNDERTYSFYNYSILRKSDNPALQTQAFSSWLTLNGIISNQSTQLEPQIRASKDSSLIQLFEKWKLNKLQILKYYELTKSELEKRGINVSQLEDETNELERALSRKSEVFSEIKKVYSLSEIKHQLNADEAYVDIVRLPYLNFNTNLWTDTVRYLAYIITKETKEIPTTVLLENGNQLEEEIASYYAENTFGKSKREKDSISYAYFWKPISTALSGKSKVYLSSGGVYNNINVQTLFNPSTNKYVSEELEIQLVNNGRTFIQQKTKKPQLYTNNTATFIGYPNFNRTLSKGSINEDAIYAATREFSPMLLDTLSRGANVSPLPGTKKEVETIGQLLKTKQWNVSVLTENNASEEEIKKVESPRVLHIATHGYFLQQTDKLQKENGLRMMGMDTKRFVENPLLRSGLLLSGANKTLKGDTTKAFENGILTAYEAAYLHLQGTELVVLSACETGKGELKNGEGVYGLRKSFADAGAKNIIMSLWKVDDKVTQEFMTSFYTNWSTGITIREAFNKTQQSIKSLYPQPYYWGAFILVGE